ncbi:hypothetical protein [Neobacillus sp. SuZ13]|uniref:hypothetical protein n=1 Tax=Neobacillus sp. SuZ13 TaxID=3047875 RepID=UPI0024C0041E|nr:hypothetical protein [Neobacillus sp. SuZ13]WHY64680.1 hypothetical protein QNH17_16265 [Neobacillus sp. SuZ13]
MKISKNQQILIDFLFKKANDQTLADFSDICTLYDTSQTAASVLGMASNKGLIYKQDMGSEYTEYCYFLTDEGRKHVGFVDDIDFKVWDK